MSIKNDYVKVINYEVDKQNLIDEKMQSIFDSCLDNYHEFDDTTVDFFSRDLIAFVCSRKDDKIVWNFVNHTKISLSSIRTKVSKLTAADNFIQLKLFVKNRTAEEDNKLSKNIKYKSTKFTPLHLVYIPSATTIANMFIKSNNPDYSYVVDNIAKFIDNPSLFSLKTILRSLKIKHNLFKITQYDIDINDYGYWFEQLLPKLQKQLEKDKDTINKWYLNKYRSRSFCEEKSCKILTYDDNGDRYEDIDLSAISKALIQTANSICDKDDLEMMASWKIIVHSHEYKEDSMYHQMFRVNTYILTVKTIKTYVKCNITDSSSV